jgi:catechol 2,3-dioxygenase-like lactoylglutathione lyase family enzyme
MVRVERTNTILYCEEWSETVAFYRDVLGLSSTFENVWFVEFELAPGSSLSVADAARASIAPGHGRGLTLSWQVPDVAAASVALRGRGIDVSPVRRRFGSPVVDLYDPAGNRIELWSAT